MSRKTITVTVVALIVLVLGGIIVWRVLGPREATEIRIGAILPLTGSAAQWGTPPRDAALMAVDEINSKGGIKGRKIKLEIEDDKCEPTAGVSAAQKILATGKPVAILGAVCSSVTLAVAPIAESNKVVLEPLSIGV